jgi:hypothetical protein
MFLGFLGGGWVEEAPFNPLQWDCQELRQFCLCPGVCDLRAIGKSPAGTSLGRSWERGKRVRAWLPGVFSEEVVVGLMRTGSDEGEYDGEPHAQTGGCPCIIQSPVQRV